MKKSFFVLSFLLSALLFSCNFGQNQKNNTTTNNEPKPEIKKERIWDPNQISTKNNAIDSDFSDYDKEYVFERINGESGIIGKWRREKAGWAYSGGTEPYKIIYSYKNVIYNSDGTYSLDTFERTGPSGGTGISAEGIYTLTEENDTYKLTVQEKGKSTQLNYTFIVSDKYLYLTEIQ